MICDFFVIFDFSFGIERHSWKIHGKNITEETSKWRKGIRVQRPKRTAKPRQVKATKKGKKTAKKRIRGKKRRNAWSDDSDLEIIEEVDNEAESDDDVEEIKQVPVSVTSYSKENAEVLSNMRQFQPSLSLKDIYLKGDYKFKTENPSTSTSTKDPIDMADFMEVKLETLSDDEEDIVRNQESVSKKDYVNRVNRRSGDCKTEKSDDKKSPEFLKAKNKIKVEKVDLDLDNVGRVIKVKTEVKKTKPEVLNTSSETSDFEVVESDADEIICLD